jgi:hypothetical protein
MHACRKDTVQRHTLWPSIRSTYETCEYYFTAEIAKIAEKIIKKINI